MFGHQDNAQRRSSGRMVKKRTRYDEEIYDLGSHRSVERKASISDTHQESYSTQISRGTQRTKRKHKLPPSVKSQLGRWTAEDDLSLISGIVQTNSIETVFLNVKFSCTFTIKELQERWYALLYDPVISRLSVGAMKQLDVTTITAIRSQTPFSQAEEALITNISSVSDADLETFENLLDTNRSVFHELRTATSLYNYWQLLKFNKLLKDQSSNSVESSSSTSILPACDFEDIVNDDNFRESRDDEFDHSNPSKLSDLQRRLNIRRLEAEIPRWQVLVEKVLCTDSTRGDPAMDEQTFAILRGRLVRYLIRSRKVTFGRATKDNQVDIDLSLEGPAFKISREQGTIRIEENGHCIVTNVGSTPFFVNGQTVSPKTQFVLHNNSVIEISYLKLIFFTNHSLVSESTTTSSSSTSNTNLFD